MDIIIQSLGFKAGENLEAFVNEKVGTLQNEKITRATVTLFKGPASAANGDYCEIRLEVPGNDHFVKRNGAHFETAITECVDILHETLNRQKSKQIQQRQGDANAIQDAIMKAEEENDGTDVELEDVVKE